MFSDYNPYQVSRPVQRYDNVMEPWSANTIAPWATDYSRIPTVGNLMTRTKEVSGLAPLLRCDIVECPNEFNIHVDLPGVRSTDLEVEITESQLVIRGERHSDYTEDTDLVHRAERSYGKVTRTIPIPKHAETKDAVANFDHGVLHIAIPKIKGERHTDKRKLEIKASK